jgi:hypothetical protein
METSDTRRQDRREYVRAVAENLWVRPGTDRPVVKPPFILLLTALTLVGALVTGIVLHFLRPEPKAEAAPPPPPPATAYTAVAGWDCTGDAGRGFEAVGRTNAWYTVPSGGWAADGCNGSFAAIPMSGSAAEDSGQYAVWWFEPGERYTTCALAAYAPRVVRLKDAAGTAVRYRLTAGRGGDRIADITVDQPAAAGRWQELGAFPAAKGGIAVRLSNAGRPPIADGRIAVAQFRVRCT